MILDNHPLMTPNTVLTDALNATLVTMNGNEMVLQNDMGNARVDNAKLPTGYVPIGIKEYGGIIYIACYNPTTNKGQVGCFPSPQRQKTATQISGITPTLTFPDVTDTGEGYFTINSLLSKCEIFPTNTIIRSGDKFSVGLNIEQLFGNSETAKRYISNYDNIIGNKVATPMNRMYTFGIATLDNSGQLRDITDQLKRYNNDQLIKFNTTDSDLYKFNSGYWQRTPPNTSNSAGVVSSELMEDNTVKTKLNTYNSKLFGRLFLYAKYNIIDSADVSIVAYKKSDISNSITNPILTNPTDSENDKLSWKTTDNNDGNILLLLYINYKYNCPDGSYSLNNLTDSNGNLLVPQALEGYANYFDREAINTIMGLSLFLTVNGSTKQYNIAFTDFAKSSEQNIIRASRYKIGFGYPIYDSVTNLYSFSQFISLPLKLANMNSQISWKAIPVMRFFDNGQLNDGGWVPDKEISGEIDASDINSGIMQLNTWNYYIDTSRVSLRWGFKSYPRENDTIKDITFEFYDISNDVVFNSDDSINWETSTPRWTYITKNRISYNGTFSESFAKSNFISEKSSNNIFLPNSIFYVRISYSYNGDIHYEYRWFVLTGLYNPSYFGTGNYDVIKDYEDFLDCYYILNGKYYEFTRETTKVEVSIITSEGLAVQDKQGNTIGGYQLVDNKNGKWVEVTDEERIQNLPDEKQLIPASYYNLNLTATMNTTNTVSVALTDTDNYIYTEKPASTQVKTIKETYTANGVVTQVVSLDSDVEHALQTNKWTPIIQKDGTTIQETSSEITYNGEPTTKLSQISTNVENVTYKDNTITIKCNNENFYTLFEGEVGECDIKQLSSLSTLPEIVTITDSLGTGSNIHYIEHSYAVCTVANSDDHKCAYIDIIPIVDNEKYNTDSRIKVIDFKANSSHSLDFLCSYNGQLYANKAADSNPVNKTFREAFESLPQDYNIIILTTLASTINYYLGESYRTYGTTIMPLKRKGSFQEALNSTRNYELFPERMFILIRSLTGEFTLVNYIYNDNNQQLTGQRTGWNMFLKDIVNNMYYYNPNITTQIYSIVNNQIYSNDYTINLNYNIVANINEDSITNDYINVLSKYPNNQVIKLNLTNKIDNITATDTLCTINSSRHLIADITTDNSLCYIYTASDNTTKIINTDTKGIPLQENRIYTFSNDALALHNQLKIQDDKLYTYNISNTLTTYPNWGWNAFNDSDDDCNVTTTLGGMPLISFSLPSSKSGKQITDALSTTDKQYYK